MSGSMDLSEAAKWKGLVREHRGSGISIAKFCEARGISVGTFYKWKRDLKIHKRGDLIPITVGQSRPLRVVLTTGAVLEFGSLVDPKWLSELLRL